MTAAEQGDALMSPLESILFVFALVATVLLLNFLAVLLVRAEERERDRQESERRTGTAWNRSDTRVGVETTDAPSSAPPALSDPVGGVNPQAAPTGYQRRGLS